jgi:hypothetical protein
MSRLATSTVLVVLGLGVGLWLGFDPRAREVAQENMERAGQFFAEVRADVSVWLNGMTSDGAATPNSPEAQNSETSASSSQAVAFRGFWDATRQVWMSLLTRFEFES